MKVDQNGLDRIKNRKIKEFDILQRSGILCTIEKSRKIENSMILGKVAKVNDIKRKSKDQATDILTIWFKEALQYKKLSTKERKMFRGIFVNDIAVQLYNVKLKIEDTLAINRALVNEYTGYMTDPNLHDLQISLGLFKPAELQQVFFKRTNTSRWINLAEWSSKQIAEPQVNGNMFSPNVHEMVNGTQNATGSKEASPSKANTNPKIATYELIKDLNCEKSTNIFAIIRSVMKRASQTSKGRYHSMIKVIDESNVMGFRVHVFFNKYDKPPVLEVNSVIRLHRLKIEKMGSTSFDGRVFNTWDVVTFDPNCPTEYYTASRSSTITEENWKRVKELYEWVKLSDLTSVSSPFTNLEELNLITRKFDFKGKIMKTKEFKENNTLVLRVHDGTTCSYPCFLVDFSVNRWKDLPEHSKGANKNSRCMDVIICDPADVYRHLKDGMDIVLRNILSFAPRVVVDDQVIKEIRLFGDGSSESLELSS